MILPSFYIAPDAKPFCENRDTFFPKDLSTAVFYCSYKQGLKKEIAGWGVSVGIAGQTIVGVTSDRLFLLSS